MEKNIFENLIEDHQNLRDMMEILTATEGASEERKKLFDDLAQELIRHAKAEERTLYQFMIGDAGVQSEASHSIKEHEEIEDAMADVKETDMSSAQWLIKFKKLKSLVEHHLDEEEDEIFVAAQEVLNHTQSKKMGKEYRQEKNKEDSKYHDVA